MPTIDPKRSVLVVIDLQARLLPVIHDVDTVLRNAMRLIEIARLLDIPTLFTEQNPAGLSATVPDIAVDPRQLVVKTTFDACRAEGFCERLPPDAHLVLVGCEAHVCVLQTALGLAETGRRTCVVGDAIGSRREDSRQAALRRLERQGVEIVTTEMVAFEWLGSADHPRFREALALVK